MTICLSPQIDLYWVKLSKISSFLAVGIQTLSNWIGAEEDTKVFLALVLNFYQPYEPYLRTKKEEKPGKKKKWQTTSERVKAQYRENFQNLYDTWCIDTNNAWSNAQNSSIISQFWKLTQKIRIYAKSLILKP